MTDNSIASAARLIREGQLVAFPTETVYGVGANALDEAAVDRIYAAKRRPAGSPLIVHVSSVAMAQELAREWSPQAAALTERFWPGPLTIVVPKAACIPDRVTAGLDTVGIRMPNHPVALELIRAAGVPIAAPSANRFTQLSPTTADHVRAGLGDRVAMVIDGGPSNVGIESTVLSLAGERAVLLRPGMISQADIESVIGRIQISAQPSPTVAHASPGMHAKHYSPRTPLLVSIGGDLPAGRGAYLWIATPAEAEYAIHMPADPHAYAACLYQVLHECDAKRLDWIAVERPPSGTMWAGITDRLERAAAK